MKNNDIENRIASAFDDMVPKDTFRKISENIVSASSEERTVIRMTEKKNSKKMKYFVSVAAACILLIAGVSGGMYYRDNVAVESIIGIDVNPGIEIEVNKNDRVIDVNAINEEGVEVLDGMDLKNTELKVAVNAIIGSMVGQGYVADENGSVLVTVQNDDTEKADEIRKEIVTDIDSALSDNNSEANIINQSVSSTDEIRKFANDNYISIGKAVFIMNIAEKDSTLDPVELSEMSITELTMLVSEKNIDISDFCDIVHDKHLSESVENAIVDTDDSVRQENEAVSNKIVVSETDAKCAAIAHAKLKTSDVENITVEHHAENNRNLYYVEFVHNGVTYCYDIDCETGEIISCGTDYADDMQMGEAVVEDPVDDHYEENEHHEDKHH